MSSQSAPHYQEVHLSHVTPITQETLDRAQASSNHAISLNTLNKRFKSNVVRVKAEPSVLDNLANDQMSY
ncbi:hypothetical protein Bpfe_020437 [Biomphalaria pfeifferi]|uniref:Uncharacterized protein n=1 Tax=Biomphalaria pfeifferi TaxID=112525 RepID=A0AAD8B906_BIOPF|nr:hypothetical protein Bpfe_020437 [Biomphalaria pfeifferi]